MPTLTPSSQHIIGSLSHNNQRRKRNKKFKIKRDKVKLSLYAVDMILCVQPEGSTQMLLELIKEFSKVAEYKINIQKPIAFIHTNNKISERDNHWILRPGPGQGSELNCPCPCSFPSDFLESRSSLLWLYPTVFSLGLFFFSLSLGLMHRLFLLLEISSASPSHQLWILSQGRPSLHPGVGWIPFLEQS